MLPDRVNRILLISLSNIGDAVLTTPVLEALHRRWPQAKLTLMVGPRAVPLFERDPRVSEIIPYEKRMPPAKRLGWLARLRAGRYDVAVDLRNSLLPFWTGAPVKTQFFRPAPRRLHRSEAHLDALRRIGLDCENVPMRLYAAPEEQAAVAQRLRQATGENLTIAVAPGARSHLKRWKADGFARVCDLLSEELKASIVLVGDAEDRPTALAVKSRMRHVALDWTGETSLRELAALFERVALVITNDSACLHIAAAAAAPLVSIFGPTDPVKYGPVSPLDEVVRLALVCGPCEKALCIYGHECMNQLEVREVLAAARRRLAK
ncbi:MAG: lipopolysaccharide heptosyltransferase II [Candidatus Omnitrophica bacterium]|nr:lipopolysaccharide heptosyltransferase II [Candidatus Omnitrophota bacterium]